MPYPAKISHLARFQQELVGRWENRPLGKLGKGKPLGGEKNPLSYNIMPLPQELDPDGYILKNFKYYERLKFNDDDVENTLAIAAEAPNRGGQVSQNARALFYEQQVKFAEGPAKNEVVHVENGAWLYLPRFVQQKGPYPKDIDKEPVTPALSQPTDVSVAKQIAVPHGNSILALGSFDTVSEAKGSALCEKNPVIPGSPVIPDGPLPYPMPATPVANPKPPPPTFISCLNADERYSTQMANPKDFQNPHPDLTQCPNKPLQEAVALIKPDRYMHWHVTTRPLLNGHGHVTNIPFEQRVSDVTDYWADYWLLFKGKNEKFLAYTQTMIMTLMIKTKKRPVPEMFCFPHVTCNTVTYVS